MGWDGQGSGKAPLVLGGVQDAEVLDISAGCS